MAGMNNLLHRASSLLDAGEHSSAAEQIGHALRLSPYLPSLHEMNVLIARRKGRDTTIEALTRWHGANPWISEICYYLAQEHLLAGSSIEGAQWLDKGLSLQEVRRQTRKLPYGTVSKARLRHDAWQIQHLAALGILVEHDYAPSVQAAESIILSEFSNPSVQTVALSPDQLMELAPIYRRCLHIHQIDREAVENPVANLSFEQAGRDLNNDGFAVLDDFLSAPALRELRLYLVRSMVWHNDAQKELNYLGAYRETGGYNVILEEVASTVRTALGLGQLEQVWAYKNIFGSKALGCHADFASVNLNVWLTPDEYRIGDGGGMIIYDREADASWSFDEYNSDSKKIAEVVLGAKASSVPYRFNRAVIFRSGMFHESQEAEFEHCYDGLRINLTMLFGMR